MLPLNSVTPDAALNGMATLIGAFVGAMLAFIFQLVIHRKQERQAALMCTHRMLFCLPQQINTILLVQKDFIAPHINNPGRFLSIPAIHYFDLEKNTFDFNSFDFMLQTIESRQIMYDLYLAQESYIEALRAVNERSRLHREEVQPCLASSGIQNGSAVTAKDIEQALSPFLFQTIISSTEQVISSFKSAFEKLEKSKRDFRNYAVKRFKTNDFTDFDFPEKYGL